MSAYFYLLITNTICPNAGNHRTVIYGTLIRFSCHCKKAIPSTATRERSPYLPSLHFLETPYTEKTFSLLHHSLKMTQDKYTTSLLISVSSQILVPLTCLSSRLWK